MLVIPLFLRDLPAPKIWIIRVGDGDAALGQTKLPGHKKVLEIRLPLPHSQSRPSPLLSSDGEEASWLSQSQGPDAREFQDTSARAHPGHG